MVRIEEGREVKDELIKKACNLAMEAHNLSSGKPYIYKKKSGSMDVFFAFAGNWFVDGWYSSTCFGEKKINISLFPSLKSVGTDEVAMVNEAFASRFEHILNNSPLKIEVEKAMSDGKQIVFAGHSSGGPIAILAALWCLEHCCTRPNDNLVYPYCITFGSPLVGDRIWSHALRRENWARYFIHFVMKYDIVPRILLAPLSSFQEWLQAIFDFINPKSRNYQHEAVVRSNDASKNFFMTVMKSASSVASYAACNLKGCTNLLLETVSNIVQLSPYRPFGTYIFCTGNGKLVVVENPDAVLQLLFYCAQMSSETEVEEVVARSLNEHLLYRKEMQESLEMQDVVHLNNLTDIPLSSNAIALASDEVVTMNLALNDLGLSTRARLCLRAAGEWEKQKRKNEEKIDGNKNSIMEGLSKIQEYQIKCNIQKVGYYDAFKLQETIDDFNANVKRLELAGIWDEIIEMLKRYELPDSFEGRKEWIKLGTQFRRQVEPLDIANYYRHLKNEDTGPYMIRARPKRYRFTQRWLEHEERVQTGERSESCFWAEVEELRNKPIMEVQNRILSLETKAWDWSQSGLLGDDVFFPESTFTKWWKQLPPQHRLTSWISGKINS
ncbi:PREDICTED: protein EDS1L-like [Nicotiana attenuata]|uniref:Protein eds1l n=1 Tax=Nicotiana attenuata TaxID=49451 RepID=A0A1J6ICF5_NICAT|nr:PREDICTED: protein EDS1L-like [Nicotiana attenuata]OIT02258.1 protein eds1l [Nicotiana attenuata]